MLGEEALTLVLGEEGLPVVPTTKKTRRIHIAKDE